MYMYNSIQFIQLTYWRLILNTSIKIKPLFWWIRLPEAIPATAGAFR